jgi:hypothetical protein
MASFAGAFRRKPPIDFGEIPVGWFVVSVRLLDKSERRIGHGKWHKIMAGRRRIYRILRFSTSLSEPQDDTEGQIVLDYMGWIDLAGRLDDIPTSLALTVRKARFWEVIFCCGNSHPDPSYRLAFQLALYLGLLSVLLGLLSLSLPLQSCRHHSKTDGLNHAMQLPALTPSSPTRD